MYQTRKNGHDKGMRAKCRTPRCPGVDAEAPSFDFGKKAMAGFLFAWFCPCVALRPARSTSVRLMVLSMFLSVSLRGFVAHPAACSGRFAGSSCGASVRIGSVRAMRGWRVGLVCGLLSDSMKDVQSF